MGGLRAMLRGLGKQPERDRCAPTDGTYLLSLLYYAAATRVDSANVIFAGNPALQEKQATMLRGGVEVAAALMREMVITLS